MMLSNTQLQALSKEVLNVQRALIERGFNPGPLDGKMGTQTRNAIMAFQKSRGLKVDGIVGPLTSAALFKAAPMSSPLSTDSGLPAVAQAVVSTGRTIMDTALSVVKAFAPSEKPVGMDVGQTQARDAYSDVPFERVGGSKDVTYAPPLPVVTVAPAPPPQFPTWALPAIIGLGVYAFASIKGK